MTSDRHGLADSVEVIDGEVVAPTAPGLGHAIDRELIRSDGLR